jgi:hypothetical protein
VPGGRERGRVGAELGDDDPGVALADPGDLIQPPGLRKLRGKQLVDKPGRTRRYHVLPSAARTISALLTLRDHVIAPILAGVRSPRMGPKPRIWTAADRDYETLRIGMQTLFRHVGIKTQPAAA